jgi:hypothetical protein
MPVEEIVKPVDASAHSACVPELVTPLSPEEVVQRLDGAARRGKLAGFETGQGPILFTTLAFGEPFDHLLEAQAEALDQGTRLTFSVKLPSRPLAMIAAVLALTVWPGVWLTHSMLVTYFTAYALSFWGTCAWYLPISVLPIPWTWRWMIRRTNTAAMASAMEQVQKIAAELSVPAAASRMSHVGPSRTGADSPARA